MMYGEPEEIIYEIDDIKVYGGFEYGIRGVDHNVLIDDKITWEKLLEYGTVIVPETKSYISNTNIKHYDDMDYNRLSLDNNHIMGFKKETNNDEQEHELNFIKRTGISENNQKFFEDYQQPLFAKKVVIEDKNDYQKVYVEAVNNQQEKQYLNIVTAEITAEKLQTFEKGLTGEEWLAEDIKSDVIAKDLEKSFTFPKEKISNSNFQPIEKVSGDLGKAFFLDKNDLKKGGLLSNNGVVFGKKGNQLVAKPASMEGNIAIFGGAGTGKTASLVCL